MIERLFLGWERPILASISEHLAARYARPGVLDLRAITAVVPGGRAGKRLKELLLEKASRMDVRLLPPRINTIGALPELLYEPRAPLADDLTARRAWAHALREVPPPELEVVLGAAPDAGDARGWDAAARVVASLHSEVAAGGHRFRDVARICATGDDLLFDDAARWEILAGAQSAFELTLHAIGRADRHLERIAALERPLSAEKELWLIGVAEVSEVAKRMLTRCDGAIVSAISAPATESDAFDEIGCPNPRAWVDRQLPVRSEQFRVVDRPADQAAAVLEELAGLGAVGAEEVAVGVTEPGLVPYIQEWFEAVRAPVHWAGGVAARRTGPHRFLTALADYLQRGDWEAFASLVRHPDVEPLFAGAVADGTLPALDRYFNDHLPSDLANPRVRDRLAGDLHPLFLRLDGLLRDFRAPRKLSDWPPALVSALTRVYGRRTLNRNDPEERTTITALEQLRDVFHEIRRLPDDLANECEGPAAIRIILDELAGKVIPDEPETAAVEVVGWLELALDDAPIVMVAGVNEPMLPESMNAHPFLPDRLRSCLGLVDNERRAARDAFHTMALVQSRRLVRFIAGRVNAAGDPLRPSRLMLATRGEELAKRILALRPSAEPSAAPSPLVQSAGTRSGFQLPPEPVLAIPPVTHISVTSFRLAMEDPYRFVLERLYGLESVHDEARELDALHFGSLAHRVLARWGLSDRVDAVDAAVIERELDELLGYEAATRFGPGGLPAVKLQLANLRSRLHRFARWQAERAAEGWHVAWVEGRPTGEGAESERADGEVPFEVDGEPVMLRGRIDRIDHNPSSGHWAILDYKTTESAQKPESTHRDSQGEWKDLQLPLYRHLAAALVAADGSRLIPDGASIEFGYVRLPKDLDAACGAMVEWAEDELLAADESARDVIRLLRRGSIAFA